MVASTIAEVMGGRNVLRSSADSVSDLRQLTRQGLPSAALAHLVEILGMPRGRVAKILSISDRTLTRRVTSNSRLTSEESDRLVRLARVLANAKETFGTMEKASRWLQTPNRALDGEAPFDLLDTDAGVEAVGTILGRIAYGVYS